MTRPTDNAPTRACAGCPNAHACQYGACCRHADLRARPRSERPAAARHQQPTSVLTPRELSERRREAARERTGS